MFVKLAVSGLILAALASSARAETVLEVQGKGVQIYRCTRAADGYQWTLKAPDATLLDPSGKVVGHHFAGPTWQAPDGSEVVGEPVAAGVPAASASIPWLVLRAKSHAGTGEFAGVTYVTRSRTEGGTAPATGCDAAHADAETSVPYTAQYTLFGVK